MDGVLIETIKLLAVALGASLTSGGIIMYFIKKHDKVAVLETKFDRLSEGMELGLENDMVIFKALREGHINGESERQEEKMNDFFFKKSLELLNQGGNENGKNQN